MADSPRLSTQNRAQERKAWIAEVNRLASDVEKWANDNEWSVRRETKDVIEDELGKYHLPVLTIQASRGRVYFNPIARYLVGADGRIEMHASPSFAQVVLLKVGGTWHFMNEDLIDLKKTWSEQSFRQIVADLLSRP